MGSMGKLFKNVLEHFSGSKSTEAKKRYTFYRRPLTHLPLDGEVLTAQNRDVGQGDFEYSEGQRGC